MRRHGSRYNGFDVCTGHASLILLQDARLPRSAKAELHLHLEGSATPETMHELAPEASTEEIRKRFHFSNFVGFLECFKWVVERLRGPEDYALVTRRLLETLDSQNVRYAEITLSAGVVLWKKQQFGPFSTRSGGRPRSRRSTCGGISTRSVTLARSTRCK